MPGRGRALGGGTWDVHTEYGGGVDITTGPRSVAAHGSVAAFEETHRRDGRLPWRAVVAPTVDVARGGFRLTAASRYYLEYVHDSIFGWDDVSRAAVHDEQGELVSGLDVVRDLARSLKLVAAEGAAVLHTGELAELISRDVLDRGGLLGPEDLAAYSPVIRVARHPPRRLDPGHHPAALGRRRVRRRDAAPPGRAGPGRQRPDDRRPASGPRPPAGRARPLRRPPERRGPLPRLRLDHACLRHGLRRPRLRGHGLLGLLLRDDRAGHRHLAQQHPGRAGTQRGRAARPPARHPAAVQHGPHRRSTP